ncbi:2Fe-2S iron-sulfur cluster-binding protein [Paenibacillus thiaminolyticus]|uniref:2Fe-2S iron-sulfur cluster-binding protein n=1 Tax=Paenibacillus thiaminolyticus TaxID=49283 RepID=UPI0035A719E6
MGTRVTFMPAGKAIEIARPTTILAAARQAGVAVRTRCGGKAGCLLCKVNVSGDAHAVTAPTPPEVRKMGMEETLGPRLACQVRLSGRAGSVKVEVPEDPLKALVHRKLEEQRGEDTLW